MSFDAQAFLEDAVNAEPDYGDDGSPLPRGWYPVRLKKVKEGVTDNGVPNVLFAAKVIDGPRKGRDVWYNLYLKASPYKNTTDQETGERIQTARTDEEMAEINNKIKYRIKGVLMAAGLDLNLNVPVDMPEDDFLREVYRIDELNGAELMFRLDIRNDRNNVQATASLDHEKNGIEAFRERLEKQAEMASAAGV